METEIRLLGGKVIKRTLPCLPGPSGPDAPTLKRLLLPQGELAQFYDGDDGIRYMAMIELRPGKSRGNHYHKIKREFVYILEGKTELIVEDVGNQQRASILMETGDLAVIETLIAHVLRPLEAGRAIEFSPARFDVADIQRYALS
jgi:uncharacterized cupin superfamily protein